jgi:hypothetical protein
VRAASAGSIVVLAALVGYGVASSCGFSETSCNGYCDFHIECRLEGCRGNESIDGDCVDACRHASKELSKSDEELMEACVSCIGEVDDGDKCAALNESCDACSEFAASADAFFEVFLHDLESSTFDCGPDGPPPYRY